MKMSLLQKNKDYNIIIEHNGRELLFDLNKYSKMYNKASTEVDLFKHINIYWSRQKLELQQEIFNTYIDIDKYIKNGLGSSTEESRDNDLNLFGRLDFKIARLIDLHDIQEMRDWIELKSDCVFPWQYKPQAWFDEYTQDDQRPGTREQTYTKPDYLDTMAFILMLRIILPIWSEVGHKGFEDKTGNFKDINLLLLLSQTKLFNSKAYYKLMEYIRSYADKANRKSAIIVGLSNDEFLLWLIADTIVNKWIIMDLTGVNPENHIISLTHTKLIGKLKNGYTNKTFNLNISDKIPPAGNNKNNSEQDVSIVENYKTKQKYTYGDLAISEIYLENTDVVLKHLDPNLDLNLFNYLHEHNKRVIMNQEVQYFQIIITQWIMSKVVNHRVLFYLTKIQIVLCITMAQTWLIQNGHLAIAGLLSVDKYCSDVSYAESRFKINKNNDSMTKLNKLYPFTKLKKPKEHGGKPEENEILKSIESLIVRIQNGDHQWKLTLPNEYIRDITGLDNYFRFNVQGLQPLLINVILDLKKELVLNM